MTRVVVVVILHAPAGPDAGPLTEAFAGIRRQNAERLAAGFRAAGADEARIVDEEAGPAGFAGLVRAAAARAGRAGLVILGSGSIPLATPGDRRAFVAAARGPAGRALTNNRYSGDIVAVPDGAVLAGLPDLASDNALPRWLAETAGMEVHDLRGRRRLQVDLDSPLDALLVGGRLAREVATDAAETVRATIERVRACSRDPRAELLVTGRASAAGLAWLERATASRTRALIEERGFRTRPGDLAQRPAASTLGLLLDRDEPAALGSILAGIGDAALVDTRVLLAHRFGAEERGWPVGEDRFASDLLLAERIADPWLRALTAGVRAAPIPIVLGGHTLVGPGLRLALDGRRSWT